MVHGEPGADRAAQGHTRVGEPVDAEAVGQGEHEPGQIGDGRGAGGGQGIHRGAAMTGQIPADDVMVPGQRGHLRVPQRE